MSSTDTSSKTYTQAELDMIIARMKTEITTELMKQLVEEKPKKIRKARKENSLRGVNVRTYAGRSTTNEISTDDDQKWIDMMVEHGAKFRQPSNGKEYGDIKKAGGKGATYFNTAKEALIFLAKEKNHKKHHNCAIVLRKNQVKGEDFGKTMWGIRKATLAKYHDEDDEKVINAPYTQGGTLWIGWGFKSDEFYGMKNKQELRDDFKAFVDMINGGAEATINDDGATTTEDDATSEEEEESCHAKQQKKTAEDLARLQFTDATEEEANKLEKEKEEEQLAEVAEEEKEEEEEEEENEVDVDKLTLKENNREIYFDDNTKIFYEIDSGEVIDEVYTVGDFVEGVYEDPLGNLTTKEPQ